MVAAARRLPLAGEAFQQLVIEPEHTAAVEGALERLRVALARDVLEELVDAAAPLEHRVVVALGPDQVRQRELLSRKMELDRMAEGDLERVILPAGAALQEELAVVGDDQELRRLAAAAREFGDRVDRADVEVRQDDGKLFGAELLALPGG